MSLERWSVLHQWNVILQGPLVAVATLSCQRHLFLQFYQGWICHLQASRPWWCACYNPLIDIVKDQQCIQTRKAPHLFINLLESQRQTHPVTKMHCLWSLVMLMYNILQHTASLYSIQLHYTASCICLKITSFTSDSPGAWRPWSVYSLICLYPNKFFSHLDISKRFSL